jgi:chloramphenicol 3-O-phosphotransferase
VVLFVLSFLNIFYVFVVFVASVVLFVVTGYVDVGADVVHDDVVVNHEVFVGSFFALNFYIAYSDAGVVIVLINW